MAKSSEQTKGLSLHEALQILRISLAGGGVTEQASLGHQVHLVYSDGTGAESSCVASRLCSPCGIVRRG